MEVRINAKNPLFPNQSLYSKNAFASNESVAVEFLGWARVENLLETVDLSASAYSAISRRRPHIVTVTSPRGGAVSFAGWRANVAEYHDDWLGRSYGVVLRLPHGRVIAGYVTTWGELVGCLFQDFDHQFLHLDDYREGKEEIVASWFGEQLSELLEIPAQTAEG